MTAFMVAVAAGALAFAVTWWLRHRKPKAADDEHQMLSFVALLKEPRYTDSVMLATTAGKAWNADLGDGSSEGDDGFVVGETPSCVIQYQGRMMLVNSFDSPYVEDPGQAAKAIPDLRLREVFAKHRAWMSCDAMGVESFENVEEVRSWYQLLGPLMSEMVDENCLAIFLPQTNQLFANMEETLDMLKAPDPLEALQEDAPVPVIQISDDDPRMKAAVQEARDRWPEFVSAFEQDSGDNFGVKAPITVGDNTEFIWLEVGAVENGVIYGKLANEPIDLGSLRIGSNVRASVRELNDWAFVDADGDAHGLFTVNVLTDAESERQSDLDDET